MPFSFLNMAFLAGLAAAAVPILIHLFSRRKSRRVEFSSLQFIEEISKRRIRRVTITQWLILALRVLAVALVALALMRPALKGDFALGKSKGESTVALILDRSFSMRASTDRGLLFDDARDRALSLVQGLDDGDEVHVIGVTPGLETRQPPFHDRLALRDDLKLAQPGWGGTDLIEAVREAGARLRDAEALNRELFIISDFQKSGLGELAENTGSRLSELVGEDVRIYLLPVGDGPIDNASVEQVALEGIGADRKARVLVANHALAPLTGVSVTVSADNRTIGEGRLSVEPGSSNTAIVPLTAEGRVGAGGQARITADRLAADDQRYFAAEGGRAFRVLVVDGAAAGEEKAPFIPLALSPAAGVGQFQTDTESALNLTALDLVPYQLVVLSNVERLNRETTGRLRAWQEAGGHLFIVLGDRIDLRHYNEELLPALMPGARLLEVRGDLRAGSTFFTLTPRVAGHPAFIGFKATPGEPLSGAQFWRVVAMEPGDKNRVLAEFGPDLPALVESEGAALLTSSLDGRWNNFGTHGAFLPLLHQLGYHLAGQESKGGALVGQALEHVVQESAVPTGALLTAIGPDNVTLAVTPKKSSQGLLLTTDPAPAPGIYALMAGGTTLASLPVNVDTHESDLTPLAETQLKTLFPGRTVRLLKPGETVENLVREARHGREFWREFLFAALFVLALEAWLARRGGA